ncbi:galanin receptor type 2-like [Mya arenaria]|uniref:galanin receptor type 2-like n=1 Tax=Mya arenaria TaxID=6604 RepID=UPI0022E67F40|nr:galanin receptor type 2-like [Mya arenaria]
MDNDNDTLVNVTSQYNTTTTSAGGGYEPGVYEKSREQLWKIVAPIIIVVGIVGNLLSVVVFLRQMRKVTSTVVFLFTLALSDIVILLCGPLRNWIRFTWDVDIRLMSDTGCRLQVYVTYLSLHFSSWLLVAVTLERAISVILPHRVKLICTPKNAFAYTLILFLVLAALNTVNIVMYSLNGVKNLNCAPKTAEYRSFRDNIFEWIDLAVSFAIPFIILLAGNAVIIHHLQRSRSRRDQLMAGQGDRQDASGRYSRSVSVLLISLCLIFLVTMTPISAYLVYYPIRYRQVEALYTRDALAGWHSFQELLFYHTVFSLLSYTNAALNFLLYVFSGTRFRSELVAMLSCAVPSGFTLVCDRSPTHQKHETSGSNSTEPSRNTSQTRF